MLPLRALARLAPRRWLSAEANVVAKGPAPQLPRIIMARIELYETRQRVLNQIVDSGPSTLDELCPHLVGTPYVPSKTVLKKMLHDRTAPRRNKTTKQQQKVNLSLSL